MIRSKFSHAAALALVAGLALLAVVLAAPAWAQTNLCTSQATGTTTPYNIFSNCHVVTNSTGATICVFTGTSGEWSTFTASSTPWSGVSVSGCTCSSPCGTISNGGTCTAYSSSTPAGPCTSQTETCSGTTLSPSNYAYGSCTAGCSATSTTWSSCGGSVSAATAGGTQSVTNTTANYTGSETATCNAGGSGAFAYSSATCTANLVWKLTSSGNECAPAPVTTTCPAQDPTGRSCSTNGATCRSYNGPGYCGPFSNGYTSYDYTCQAASDARLKTDVQCVGRMKGHNIYEFSYRADPEHHRYRGVMAQEVLNVPGAVVTMPNGYYAVDYGVLGIPFVQVR